MSAYPYDDKPETKQNEKVELKLPPVPKALAPDKVVELKSKLVFPSHIPRYFHPFNCLADLIRELDAAVVENNNSGGSSDTNTYVQGGGRKFSQDDIETLKNKSSDSSNMMKEIETIKNKCRHLEWNTESRNEHAGQNDRNIESLISEMNYRYCIASVTCPGRIAALNKCFSRYPPAFVEALYKEGRREYLCGKERGAVERCCGQKVQSVMRQLLEDK